MNRPVDQAMTGFVLAGGQSTRMGSDKAFLRLGDETLLARAMNLAGAVCSSVRIVGNADKFGGHGNVVEDVFPGRGPLGGIHAALNSSHTDLNLMLAVDLPFVDPRFLEYLVTRACASDAIVLVPRTGNRWQPLCAIYRRPFAAVAEAALTQGNNRIDALFGAIKLGILDENEIARAGFSCTMFRNLNTPEDWDWAQHRL